MKITSKLHLRCAYLLLLAGMTGACKSSYQPLPNDTAVRTGVLSNGLTYYIRKNAEPRQQAYLMLVNKVGSLVENDDQQGLAHFTEHMAFKGTQHFPDNTLVGALQQMGVRFGADLNAYTSFDQTVYKLDIPLKDSASLGRGLLILHDWAGHVEMETAAIDAERGVILEEKRQRQGMQERISEQTLPILLNNAKHVKRLPIGTEEVLKNFKPELLKKFYGDWYRPDLQAIIVVGDFDPDDMEQRIKQQFAGLVKPSHAPPLPVFPVTLNGNKTFNVVRDEEIKTASLQLFCKERATPLLTGKELRRAISIQLFNEMLSKRIDLLQRQSDPPFLQASAGIGTIAEGLEGPSVQISFLPGGIERGYTALMTELQRLKVQGFTDAELKRAKTSLSEAQDQRYNQREKISSEAYANQYAKAFIQNTPFPGEEYLNKVIREQVSELALSDINKLVKLFFDTPDQDVIILAPSGGEETMPAEADLKAWAAKAAQSKPTTYKETDVPADLPQPDEKAGTIVETKKHEGIDVAEWKLSNGARVILKPTNFQDDKILINAFSYGGTSLYGQSDYDAAMLAVPVTLQGGVGGIDAQALSKILTGKMIQFQPFIGDYTEGFSGASNKKDVEACLKLIHLYFTKPSLDEAAVTGMLRNMKIELEKREQLPANIFMDSISAFLNGNNWRKQPMTASRVDGISPARAVEIFKERFTDASGFTFVITGNFESEAIKPLIEKYLASLPALHKNETGIDMGIRFADRDRSIIVKGEIENKATVQIVIPGGYKGTPWENVQLNVLRAILQYRITEHLRTKESATYSPAVSVQKTNFPAPRYAFNVSFSCDPARAKDLAGEVRLVLDQLAQNGPSSDELAKFLAESRAGIAKMSVTSEYWHNLLLNSLQNGYDLEEVNSIERYLGAVKAETIKEAAKEFLKKKPFMDFYLMPR